MEFSGKHSFTLHPSLDPYRQNYGQRLKYTCFAWAGGTFFSVVLLCFVSFWFWQEKGFDLHTNVLLRVQYSCGVVLVFWFWWEIGFGVTSIKTNTYPLHLRSIHTILCKIGHMIQIVPG